jgi:hypothetical protein
MSKGFTGVVDENWKPKSVVGPKPTGAQRAQQRYLDKLLKHEARVLKASVEAAVKRVKKETRIKGDQLLGGRWE